jgi:hypothetical protein
LKTIIRLLVVALLLNAALRVGNAFWRYYAFKDDVEQLVRFGETETAASLHRQILQIAEEQGIDLYPADLVVEKEKAQTHVSALYGEQIELLPRVYQREHLFEFDFSIKPTAAVISLEKP